MIYMCVCIYILFNTWGSISQIVKPQEVIRKN